MIYRKVLLLVLVASFLLGAQTFHRVRKPVLSGSWYPADKQQLWTAAQQYIQEAPAFGAPGKLAAIVMPHERMGITGPMSAPVLQHVQAGDYDRIIVLTSCHVAEFRGGSMAAVQVYQTPLGSIPVETPVLEKLSWSTLLSTRSVSYRSSSGMRIPVHEKEYGIEAVLPYLQVQNGTFFLVPIVLGKLDDYQNKPDIQAIDEVADAIRPYMGPRTLLVVSSHFTRFGFDHGYRPFEEDIVLNIEKLDLQAISFVLKRDVPGFLAYLEETRNPIDGAMPLAILMRLLPTQVVGKLSSNVVTADITGDTTNSVSYASIGFFNPTIPASKPAILPGRAKPPVSDDPPLEPRVPTAPDS